MALCQSYYMRGGKKKKSPLDSRAVRNSSASQHESQLVRQSHTPCSAVLNIINVCVVCAGNRGRWPPPLRCRKKRRGEKRRERVFHAKHSLSCSQSRDLCVSTASPRAPDPPESYCGSWKDHRGNIFSVDLQPKWRLKNNCALEIGTVSAQVNWTFDYLYNQPLRHSLISADGTERKIMWYQSWILTCSYWASCIYKWRNNRS